MESRAGFEPANHRFPVGALEPLAYRLDATLDCLLEGGCCPYVAPVRLSNQINIRLCTFDDLLVNRLIVHSAFKPLLDGAG